MRRKPHLGFDERSEMAKQSCRPDQIEMPLRPFEIGLSGFFVCLAVSLAESGRICQKGLCWGNFLGNFLGCRAEPVSYQLRTFESSFMKCRAKIHIWKTIS